MYHCIYEVNYTATQHPSSLTSKLSAMCPGRHRKKLNKTWSDFIKWPVIRSSNCKTLPSSKCFLPSCSISRRESLRVLYSSFCWHLFWKLPFMFRSASCVLWSSLMLLVHHHFDSKAPKPKVIVRKAWNCPLQGCIKCKWNSAMSFVFKDWIPTKLLSALPPFVTFSDSFCLFGQDSWPGSAWHRQNSKS